jgi:hypothetical protein
VDALPTGTVTLLFSDMEGRLSSCRGSATGTSMLSTAIVEDCAAVLAEPSTKPGPRLSADEWQLAYREGKELGTDVVLASFVR